MVKHLSHFHKNRGHVRYRAVGIPNG